ncbi:unnamed protein product [Cladocopium goreaui]|uniref:Helicase ATP-binding domain-containing protein n=1 Tax=Cladocopium goreaui TaxID=2562237 RepID=A0A9P1D8U1_9DINO|nr:unnamed protein product [Cladocopium goreaui]
MALTVPFHLRCGGWTAKERHPSCPCPTSVLPSRRRVSEARHRVAGSLVLLLTLKRLQRRKIGGHLAATGAPVPVTADADAAVPKLEVLEKPKPWLQRFLPQGENNLAEDELLVRFMEALEERGVQLYPAQEEAIVELFSGAHVVLDTPTGSGKSLVAVAALFQALGVVGGKAYYTSPTKALTSEKFFDLCRHFGAQAVGMATGDVSINTGAPLVCCTQEVLTSISLRCEANEANAPTLVVMDEFHYFGDPDRGAAWELPLWRFSRPGCQTQFLLMSGTLGANAKLYETLQERSGRPLRVVSSKQRPVPLHFSYSQKSVADSIAELISSKRAPVYVVHFSQREALETAKLMAEALDAEGKPVLHPALRSPAELQRRVEQQSFASPFGAELKELLLRGVGVHHAGLLPCYRRLVEQLTQESLLALVCGTDTLGVGINVPIRSVLFTRLCKFDGEGTRIMRSREFHQIAGRAGRKGFDIQGDVMAVDPDWVVYNRDLEDKIKSSTGRGPLPRWRRPPRRNYKHWTERTFSELQRSEPDPLKSQFRLSMAQVLSVLESSRGARDGEQQLDDLISAAQCSLGARRFWRRQVKAYVAALESYVQEPENAELTAEAVTVATPSIPLDDGTLFVLEAAIFLQKFSLSEEDWPLVVLAAAEGICDLSEALRRAVLESPGGSPGRCPSDIESFLFEAFNDFRRKRPWISPNLLQPKGIALELPLGAKKTPGDAGAMNLLLENTT